MKNLALALSLFAMTCGVALAEDKPAAKPADETHAGMTGHDMTMHGTTHEVTAEVVSADTAKNTITIKGDKENKTVPVEGKAIASLKTVKAGEKVTLVCRDNEKGEHQAIAEIKEAVKSPASK